MFELYRLQGGGSQGIALQTKTGRDIRNELGIELTESHCQRFEKLLRGHPNWQQRKPPTGEYNCAGHVWASRRTCIYDEIEWQKILSDDGYRLTRHPVPDDLVIYVDRGADILHIGRVVELREGVAAYSDPIPWVVSKWNDWAGEVCHFCHDHPFGAFGFDVSAQFWTDRPEA